MYNKIIHLPLTLLFKYRQYVLGCCLLFSGVVMKILTLCVAILLIGCVSNVEPLNDFGEFAPTDASSEEWYTVSYLAKGASFVQVSRRKDAYRKCISIAMVSMSLEIVLTLAEMMLL